MLLDLAESCEMSLKRLCLSNICTILENPKSFSYFVEWNSRRENMNASQLMVKLYGEEDKRFGVQSENGILQNVDRALNPNTSFNIREGLIVQQEGVIQPEIQGDNDTPEAPTVQGSQMTGTSTIKRNLQEAMKTAAEIGKTQDSRLTELMNDFAKGYDTRSVIFGTFYRCGFDLHDLQPKEKQLMEIV